MILRLVFALFYCTTLFSLDYPSTPQKPATLQFPGRQITDPYLWLEKDDDPEVQQWEEQQCAFAEQFLSSNPYISRIEERLNSFTLHRMQTVTGGSRIITVIHRAEMEHPIFFMQEGKEGERVEILNGNKLKPYTCIESFQVSPNGRYFSYLTTEGGNEKPQIHLIDLDTLEHMSEPLPGTSQNNLVWHPNSEGFFYTVYPENEVYHHQGVFYHEIGASPEKDRLILLDAKKNAWIYTLHAKPKKLEIGRSRRSVKGIVIQECYSIPYDHLDAEPELFWECGPNKPARYPYHIGKTTYIRTNENAPNFRFVKSQPAGAAVPFIKETKDVALDLCQVGNFLAATYLSEGHTLIKIFNRKGQFLHKVSLPGIGIAAIHKSTGPLAELTFESLIHPPATYEYNAQKNTLTVLSAPYGSLFDSSEYLLREHFVGSKDGTKIPIFIAHKKDLELNGDCPVLLHGYGGFNHPLQPEFDKRFVPWMEAGGVVVFAGLRGGGEYGIKWHMSGTRENKQNTFDDCISVAEWLIRQKYTNPSRLALYGRSNGGLLVGAVVTQRPDLFKAAFCGVALLDMLRYDQFPLGGLWRSEYGDPKSPGMFPFLYNYSPYHHHLNTSAPNPAILFIAGKNDARLHPMHMRKMAARLQAAYPDGNPILYWVDPADGHLFSSIRNKNRFTAIGLGFLMEQVGLSL